MARQTKEIVINAPADKVFSYIADLPRHPEWALHPLRITANANASTAVGSTFRSLGHQFGRDNEDEVTVKESIPNQRFVFESSGKSGIFRHEFELQTSDGATRLRKSFEPVSLPLMGKLMMPLVSMMLIPKALTSDLQKIKSKLE